MQDFSEILEAAEQDGLKSSQAALKVLMTMWNSAREDLKEANDSARKNKVIAWIAGVLAVLSIASSVYLGTAVHTLQGEVDGLQKILENGVVVEETTTTEETYTTIDQDTGEGNGTNIYQSGENSSVSQGELDGYSENSAEEKENDNN